MFFEKVIGKGAFGKVLMVRIAGDPHQKVYAMKGNNILVVVLVVLVLVVLLVLLL